MAKFKFPKWAQLVLVSLLGASSAQGSVVNSTTELLDQHLGIYSSDYEGKELYSKFSRRQVLIDGRGQMVQYCLEYSKDPEDSAAIAFATTCFFVDQDQRVYHLLFTSPLDSEEKLNEDIKRRESGYCRFGEASYADLTVGSDYLVVMDYCGDSSPRDDLKFSIGSVIRYTVYDKGGWFGFTRKMINVELNKID